jgi:ornithine cyclodeaminase/alanine dehydrogenase-like protein (mu-crystallin family)
MAKMRMGLVGCGFVAELHMYAYKRVYGLETEVRAVAARCPLWQASRYLFNRLVGCVPDIKTA